MRKVIVVNVNSGVQVSGESKSFKEFELTEVNKLLEEGWSIVNQEIVTNQITYNFSIVYILDK